MELRGAYLPLEMLGIKVRGRKLSEEQIIQIIEKRSEGDSVNSLAKEYKVNRGTILYYTCPKYRERIKELRRERYKQFKDGLDTKAKKIISEQNRKRYLKKKEAWEKLSYNEKVCAMKKQIERYSQRMKGIEMFKIRVGEYKNGKRKKNI